jgi:DASS family divalent anion:Na+ symporter
MVATKWLGAIRYVALEVNMAIRVEALSRGGEKSQKNIYLLLLSVIVGLSIWYSPAPEGLNVIGWKTFAIFVFTLFGIILKPIPSGAVALVSLTLLCSTKILTFSEAFAGFSCPTVWLIVLAFFIARGFIKTGLGLRIAYNLMTVMGRSTLGMAYGIALTDWILGSAIPSVTARAGGVIYPVVTSLSKAFDSHPDQSSRKMGAYLVQTAFQCGAVTSAMFLTAMAGNPIIQSLAESAGVKISWGTWALAAIVPGMISLLTLPLLIYKLYPPEIKKTPMAKEFAKERLKERGGILQSEWLMIFAFIFMVTLWMLAPVLNINTTVTALMGLTFLVLSGVLSWDDVLNEKGAWDTLIWFASLATLAATLNKFGFMTWFSGNMAVYVEGMSWYGGFLLIALFYYYSHYLFASNIAHITTMYAPFLFLSIAIGVPPMLAALLLGFFSSLFGSLTTYGCGPAPIFYGSGYVEAKDWWRLGFLISLFNIVVWLGIGGVWWKILGLY